jgi:Na+/H+-dicarboxylate symporter
MLDLTRKVAMVTWGPPQGLHPMGVTTGIDRFMATGSSVTNVIGNAVAVLAIARWDNAFDRAKFYRCLAARKGV